jgi:hypothetical protein
MLFGVPHAAMAGRDHIPPVIQAKMECALQADFSDVRIHEDGEAAAMGARAFTRGSDLHFASGRYQPETHEGQRLLGHELAHVIQQRQGRVAPGNGCVNADPALEREADELGARAAAANDAPAEAPQVAPASGARVTAAGPAERRPASS